MTVLSLEAVTSRHRIGRRCLGTLQEVSLDVWPGEVLAILGAPRSGKTTLLRVAAGIETPLAGVVRLDGCDLRRLSRHQRTQRLRKVGFVPKTWDVARGKAALDHVRLPVLADGATVRQATTRALETLERVGAADRATTPTHELLPSQATRVALAQALVVSPRLLLVDEPGIAGSTDERDDLLRLLHSLVAETPALALVIATQQFAAVQAVQRVLPLAAGRLRSLERPADVLPFLGRTRREAGTAR